MLWRTRLGTALLAGATIVVALAGCAPPPAPPPGITTAQRRAATQEELDLQWTQLTRGSRALARPTVAIVRYTTYLDQGRTMAACLNRGGYGTTWTAKTGLVRPILGVVPELAYQKAVYVCEAEYPMEPAELGFLSSGQEAELFTYWQASLIPCLRRVGVRVAPTPPIGEFGEGEQAVGPNLGPYANVIAQPKGTVLALLYGACPPYPSDLLAGPRP